MLTKVAKISSPDCINLTKPADTDRQYGPAAPSVTCSASEKTSSVSTGTLAGFSTVIDSRKADVVTAEICRLVREHGVTELVLGYPKNMDGTLGPRAEKCAAYADTLREATGLNVTLWDERRSTVEAHAILFNNGKNGKQRKKTVDAVAASLMLEGYLTRKRLEGQR